MKWVLFFLIMLFLFNDKALTVMNYSDDAKEYTITLNSVNTDNFSNYFNYLKVISIYPDIDVSYESKIDVNLKEYYFDFNTNEKNIKNFKDKFINNVRKIGYNNKATLLTVEGIKIKKVKVFDKLENIKNSLKNVKYSLTNNTN